ncbi:AI-2E family transporter [Parasphingopyxis sp.]|uniref:AI-2E family transporter n=1 Tax=Parasphingopyxis sp. TaxID=1920299 RepID=UPI002635FB14|nr:AI-2E family transporter [Parasphingopyxis sp.]
MTTPDDEPGPYDGKFGPAEVRDPVIRRELKRATAWAMVAVAVLLVWQLAQALLLILAGIVFASLLDGGTKLLRPIIPFSRALRLLVVVVLIIGGLAGVGWLAGIEIANQAEQLRITLTDQFERLLAMLDELGMTPGGTELTQIIRDVLGSVGSLTSALGSAVSGIATLFLIMVIGLFIAIDPNLYDRGIQWMLPRGTRPEFRKTTQRMSKTLQRLLAGRVLGMVFEGFITWLGLTIAGVPMALLLGILAGLLAFIPNIGAFITGVLMVAVGLSASPELGFYAFLVYLVVQTFDGYVVIPMVAKQTVDLPPALTLSAQILFAALFGIIGLALADPIVAMIKAALERRSEHNDEEEEAAQRRAAEEGATPTDPG